MTYSGHPLASAAAVGAIGAMHEEGTVEAAARLGRELLGPGLGQLADRHPSVGDVRGIGALWTLELVHDRETKQPIVPVGAVGDANAPMAAFTKVCLGRDMVPLVLGNRVHVAPPLNVSDADVEIAMSVLDEALTEADAFVA
jgi:taurine--2-oxoglutarate transaminase